MTTLAAAFALAWTAVAAYLGWLGLHNRRLETRLSALEDTARHEPSRQRHSRAA